MKINIIQILKLRRPTRIIKVNIITSKRYRYFNKKGGRYDNNEEILSVIHLYIEVSHNN